MMSPRVTIVIVTWNKKEDVINLLNSIRGIKYDNFSIVVVDNASTDDTVPAIKAHDLRVHLIENLENLGGTGGFNTGIQYAISELAQDYIWLLDNDAEVTPDTLSELVKAMDGDASLGIAGSCIMSPEDRNLIVEAGAFVDWKSGTWGPNFRYHRYADLKVENVIEVDYVAACSALVRDAVAKELGGMDGRYFLHWDDIDFCLSIRDLGYRCVSVLSSRVYHGVEKGFNPNVLYYDFRNALLTISKHLYGYRKLRAYLSVCFNAFAFMFLEVFQGRSALAHLIFSSITDFIFAIYGKSSKSVAISYEKDNYICDSKIEGIILKIIVFVDGAYNDIIATMTKLNNLYPNINITLLVNSEKYGILHSLNVDEVIIANNLKDSILKKAIIGNKILFGGFDCGVSCVLTLNSPYAYLVKKHYTYDSSRDEFFLSDKSIRTIWKVSVAIFMGMVTSLFSLPVVWSAGLREKRSYGCPKN